MHISNSILGNYRLEEDLPFPTKTISGECAELFVLPWTLPTPELTKWPFSKSILIRNGAAVMGGRGLGGGGVT